MRVKWDCMRAMWASRQERSESTPGWGKGGNEYIHTHTY